MKTAWYISARLLGFKGGKRNRTAAIVSITGIALSIITILLTFSIARGFQKELKEKIFAFSSPISVYTFSEYYNDDSEKDLEIIEEAAKEINRQSRVTRTIFIPSLLKSDNNFKNIVLQNVNDSIKRDYFKNYIVRGTVELDTITNGLCLSKKTAEELGIDLGDRLDVILPAGETYKLRKLIVSGIFDTHFSDYDDNIGFVPETFIKSIIKNDTKASNRISIDFPEPDLSSLPFYSSLLQSRLNEISFNSNTDKSFTVNTIMNEAGVYFGWLSLMNTNVDIILILMSFISVFTLICSIIIIILDKVPLIGLLKTLGSPKVQIRRIFIISGIKIISWAIIIANICTYCIIYCQNKWHFLMLNPDQYYLTEVPMDFNPANFIVGDIAVIVTGLLAMALPVSIVNGISPSKVIRFK